MGAAGVRVGELPGGLPATADTPAEGAHGPQQHVYPCERHGRVGLLSVGFFGDRGRAAFGGTRADDAGAGETQQPVGDRAQPHFTGASVAAGGPGGYTCNSSNATQQTFDALAPRWSVRATAEPRSSA